MPRVIRDVIYDLVERNRYRWSAVDQHRRRDLRVRNLASSPLEYRRLI